MLLKLFTTVLLITSLLFLFACSTTIEKKSDHQSFNFYLQIDNEKQHFYEDNSKQWTIESVIARTDNRSKTFYYDFTLHSSSEDFVVTDIQYKYGNYGKWRIIKKEPYLTNNLLAEQTKKIIDFPITIKKNGKPHDQLLHLTLKTKSNKTKYINLIFGVKKCLATKAKEFVCF